MLWLIKVGAKIVLSRLPAGYGLWQKLGLFRHGAMDSGEYALDVVSLHLGRIATALKPNFVALELGPGDSVSSALIARCRGARKVYLVDSGSYATRDMRVYEALAQACKARGLSVPADIDFSSFDRFLASCNAEYLTDGVQSLRRIPSASVDATWSHAVLEHVRLGDFQQMLAELNRIFAPNGAHSHRVDLKDHLSGGLDNLRFSQRRWESNLFRNSGFYTNRIRYSQMLDMFRDAGFRVEVCRSDTWQRLPVAASKLAEPFRSMPVEELMVSGFDVLASKAPK